MCVCVYTVFVELTLNDVGDHECGAGVVTDETTAGQIVFNLQGKQIPAERKTERTKESVGGRKDRKHGGYEVNARFINSTVKSNSITINCRYLYTNAHTDTLNLLTPFSVNHCTVGCTHIHTHTVYVAGMHLLPGHDASFQLRKNEKAL